MIAPVAYARRGVHEAIARLSAASGMAWISGEPRTWGRFPIWSPMAAGRSAETRMVVTRITSSGASARPKRAAASALSLARA